MAGPIGAVPSAIERRTPMSHRAAVLVAGVLGILAFRWYTSGKLGKAAAAWAGAGTGSNNPAGVGSDMATSSTNVPQGKGAFGLSGVTYSREAPPQYWSGANAPDRGLVPNESGEWNYGLAPGSKEPVYLPGGGRGWTEVQQGTQAGLGGYEVWKDPAGGLLAFLHLSELWDATAGTGGPVGVTGWPTSAQFGAGQAGPNNAHLAVIYGPESERYVQK